MVMMVFEKHQPWLQRELTKMSKLTRTVGASVADSAQTLYWETPLLSAPIH
jgi:hypothetical protein